MSHLTSRLKFHLIGPGDPPNSSWASPCPASPLPSLPFLVDWSAMGIHGCSWGIEENARTIIRHRSKLFWLKRRFRIWHLFGRKCFSFLFRCWEWSSLMFVYWLLSSIKLFVETHLEYLSHKTKPFLNLLWNTEVWLSNMGRCNCFVGRFVGMFPNIDFHVFRSRWSLFFRNVRISSFVHWRIVGEQYRRIIIKGLLRYCPIIRRLTEVKCRGLTSHRPWKSTKLECSVFRNVNALIY